jgi:hypothetical protein
VSAAANEVKEQTSTALTLPQRAAVALRSAETEQKLVELASASKSITAITNPDSYKQCHAARMSLKRMRIEIERTGKAAREDATAFSKAVIAEEKRLIGLIDPEETRLEKIQTAHDAEVERQRAERVAAEQRRVASIQSVIAGMAAAPARVAGQRAAVMLSELDDLRTRVVEADEFAEFTDQARATRDAVIEVIQTMHGERVAFEAEQERQRQEAERLRLEREAAEREAAAERQRLAEEKARQEAAAAAERARQEAEDRERREAAAQREAALQEIRGIEHQALIAVLGRAGVRKGGTLACARETLAETEAWEVTPEHFGALYGMAVGAKAATVEHIRGLIAEMEKAAETRRLADEQQEREAAQLRAAAERIAAERAQLEREREEHEARERVAAGAVAVPVEPEPEPEPEDTFLVPGEVQEPAVAATQVESQPVEMPRPSDEQLVQAISDVFDVSDTVAREWLDGFGEVGS